MFLNWTRLQDTYTSASSCLDYLLKRCQTRSQSRDNFCNIFLGGFGPNFQFRIRHFWVQSPSPAIMQNAFGYNRAIHIQDSISIIVEVNLCHTAIRKYKAYSYHLAFCSSKGKTAIQISLRSHTGVVYTINLREDGVFKSGREGEVRDTIGKKHKIIHKRENVIEHYCS